MLTVSLMTCLYTFTKFKITQQKKMEYYLTIDYSDDNQILTKLWGPQ